jgi:hypothetical protein
MGFQTTVQEQPGVAVAGNFASANPRASKLAGPGQLVAPVGGLIVGQFFFINPTTGAVSQTFATGDLTAFLHRENQALITQWLADSAMVVPQGYPITGMVAGDFWAKFAGGATAGQAVYADDGSGLPISSATAPVALSATASIGTTADASASATAGVMTVTAAPSGGKFYVGDTITGTGVPAGTTIGSLGTGTGGTGTYNLSPSTTAFAAATNVQASLSTVATVTAVGTGSITPGQTLTGGAAGTVVDSQLTGTAGSTGTYRVSPAQNTPSGTFTSAGGVLTKFTVASNAAPGELAKITTWG